MNQRDFPLYFFPSLILFVDDEKSYADQIAHELALENSYHFQTITNPQQALDLLINNNVPLVRPEVEGSKWLYSPTRFQHTAVVIIDEAMPRLRGSELCFEVKKQLKYPPKFIMLTGQADAGFGVEVLRDRYGADDFIEKLDPGVIEKLIDAIHRFQCNYLTDYYGPLPVDTPVSDFLIDYYLHPNVTEYYCLNDSGSSLLLDHQGHPRLFGIVSEDDIEQQLDVLRHLDDEGLAKELTAILRSREHILCLPTDKALTLSPNDWRHYLLPAKPVPDAAGFYYGETNQPSGLINIDPSRIFSYIEFLNKN